ncbi:MAG TPA: hypothetical protein DEG32_11830 [Balneolaceae bacterium]|nr:hypothetical protein [Balneolaceae bacterium]
MDTLIMAIESLNKHGIELYLSGLIGPVRDVIRKSDISTFLSKDRIYSTVHDAVEAALKKQDLTDEGNRLSEYSNRSA